LTESLSAVSGDNLYDAQRLIHGTLTRAEWNRLARVLDGYSVPEKEKRTTSPSEIDVLLWTDQPFYRPRDLVTINVSVDKACHLTLIDVDQQGKAIVLFPNELEQDNLVAPGVTIRVPGRDADYQFRFDHSGEEQIVAICQRTSSRPAGIDYDYEKQRFQTLGDWREFIRTAPEREKEIREREVDEAARRNRRRGSTEPAAAGSSAVDPEGPAVEGRAAITVVIEPGKP
jgi:hypothetical protein